MPEQIGCPACGAKLRVPETLFGKQVKCPKCQTTFTAAAEQTIADPEEGIVREPTPSARKRPPRQQEPEDDLPEEMPPDDEGDEERPRRRRRRRSSRGRRSDEVAAAVAPPAICLMVLGGFDVLLQLLNVLLTLLGHGMAFAGQARPGIAADAGANLVGSICGTIIGMCFSGTIIFGAVKMKQLENYGLAMTASILALLPCGNCCLLGIPFGIWAIVVLNRPDVRDAFN